jgi:hypothetical protein
MSDGIAVFPRGAVSALEQRNAAVCGFGIAQNPYTTGHFLSS